jgi:hypothetical protein
VSRQILVSNYRGGRRPRARGDGCEKEEDPNESFRFHDLAPGLQQEGAAGSFGDFPAGGRNGSPAWVNRFPYSPTIDAVSLSINSG